MTEDQILRRNVEHLHGPKEIPYGENELIVVCVVRDGRPYVKSFVEHYLSLSVKHLVFLDNDSSDGTVEALKDYDNVTVLRTKLPFEEYRNLMRQYLIARFGKEGWSLCVDIDELFDYPYSDVIGLDSLLGYLNSKSYTAVTAQMVDMFPEKPLSGLAGNPNELLKELHRFYDVSGIRRRNLKGHPRLRNNTLESEEIKVFSGRVRDTEGDTEPHLTKFPLVFSDGRVKPVYDSPHGVDNARIADFTCVLFHYEFLDEHLREHTEQAGREEQYWKDSGAYMQPKQETSRELEGVNDLLENQFLVVSDDYVSWVNAEEEKSILQAPQSEPRRLTEAFLESRRRERAKTLKIQRLEQQLRANQRLRQRVRYLKQQLESRQASRTWKLMKMLHHVGIGAKHVVPTPLRRLKLKRLKRKLANKVVHRPLRRLRRKHRQYVFWRAMRRFCNLPRDAVVPTTILSELIYGWGNPWWSVKHEYARAFLQYAQTADGPILECGSGLSTVLLGLVAQRNGNKVWSLEHDSFWAEKVRSTLKRYGIRSVELCETDLRNYGPYSWYGPPKDRMPKDFSVVICDGPPGTTHGGRYGMLPVMGSHLKPGCVVLLDDAGRAGERKIVARWAEELGTDYEIADSEKPFAILTLPSTSDRVEPGN